MTKTDFTYTYCYKDARGSIGLTNNVSGRDVAIYTRDEPFSWITMLDDQDTYRSADKVLAGILIESPENPEGFVKMEIIQEMKMVQIIKIQIELIIYIQQIMELNIIYILIVHVHLLV